MDSDEEERLLRWKQHLASESYAENDDDGLPPGKESVENSMVAQGGVEGDGGSLSSRGEKRQVGWDMAGSSTSPNGAQGAPSSGLGARMGGIVEEVGGSREEIDWGTALMPQMREMQVENAKLTMKLRDQEKELSTLRAAGRSVSAYVETARPESGLRDAKETKIVELAKKNRALTVALEKERAKTGRLAAEMSRVANQLDEAKKGRALTGMDARSLPMGAASGREAQAGNKGKQHGPGDDTEEPPSAEAQVKALQRQLSGMNAVLNAQRVANDTLKQEHAKLKEALRRELGDLSIDKALEEGSGWTGRAQQVSLLQSKVSQLRRELQTVREVGVVSGSHAPGSPQQDAAWKVEDQRRKELEKIERDRRRDQEVMSDELERVKGERDSAKKLFGSAQSRVKNLEKDCKDLRDKISVLLTKTDNDDGLISALQNEMQAMARRSKDEKKRVREQQGTASELQELRNEIADRDTKIERQHKVIVSLRAEVQAASMRMEVEQRDAVANGEESLRTTQAAQKARVVEVQLSKAEELIDMLKRRLEESEARMQEANGNLRREKQRNVELERSVEGRRGHGSAPGRRTNSAPGGYPPEKVEMLVDRLNGMTEEMEALQESFRRTLEVKESEVAHLRECLRQLS